MARVRYTVFKRPYFEGSQEYLFLGFHPLPKEVIKTNTFDNIKKIVHFGILIHVLL
jgi:hypothetical protein